MRYLVDLLNQMRRYSQGPHDAIAYSLSVLAPFQKLAEEMYLLTKKEKKEAIIIRFFFYIQKIGYKLFQSSIEVLVGDNI